MIHYVICISGVRYAKPPVGELRFKKPEPADPWTGVELAQKGKGVCLHYGAANIGTGEVAAIARFSHV